MFDNACQVRSHLSEVLRRRDRRLIVYMQAGDVGGDDVFIAINERSHLKWILSILNIIPNTLNRIGWRETQKIR